MVLGFGSDAEEFAALAQQKVVGHAGDVVTNDAVARRVASLFGVLGRHLVRMIEEESKQFVEGRDGAVAVFGDGGFGIEPRKEETFQRAVLFRDFGGESDDAFGVMADIFDRLQSRFFDLPLGIFDQVGGQTVEDLLEGFVEFQFFFAGGVTLIDFGVGAFENRQVGAELLEVNQMRFVAIVEVGGVVGDFVDQVDESSFERWALVEEVFGKFGMFGRVVVARMLDDSFADFEGEIEPRKIQVALLEMFDDVERVQIVIEALAEFAQAQVELFFSGVAERRMANVMDQRESFGEIGIQS